MIQRFENLSKGEFAKLKDAVALITILIAGADGDIEEKELEWAKKVTDIRKYASTESLNAFYTEVGTDYDEKISYYVKEFPKDTSERTQLISNKLAVLNDVFPKLDPILAYDIYKSFKSFAEHVAKASGGFLRMFSISGEEKALMSLPMINEIEKPEDDSEGEQTTDSE